MNSLLAEAERRRVCGENLVMLRHWSALYGTIMSDGASDTGRAEAGASLSTAWIFNETGQPRGNHKVRREADSGRARPRPQGRGPGGPGNSRAAALLPEQRRFFRAHSKLVLSSQSSLTRSTRGW
jgi:hypothetical protein